MNQNVARNHFDAFQDESSMIYMDHRSIRKLIRQRFRVFLPYFGLKSSELNIEFDPAVDGRILPALPLLTKFSLLFMSELQDQHAHFERPPKLTFSIREKTDQLPEVLIKLDSLPLAFATSLYERIEKSWPGLKRGIEISFPRGSQVWVSLPIEESKITVLPHRHSLASVGKTQGMVLLADDNPMVHKLYRSLIEELTGFGVMTVENGLDAVHVCESYRFNLVLLDCRMPIMNGYRAASILNKTLKDEAPPILALTAHVRPEDLRLCRESGIAEVISKSTNENEFRDKILKWARV